MSELSLATKDATFLYMNQYTNREVLPEEVLIVVLHADRHPWSEIARFGQCETWVPQLKDAGFEVMFAFSDNLKSPSAFIDKIDMYFRIHAGAYPATFRNYFNQLLARGFSNSVPKLECKATRLGNLELLSLKSLVPDLYLTSRWKRLSVLNYFLSKKNFRYLVCTTSSSYIYWPKLILDLKELPLYCVGGRVMNPKTVDSFVSGSFSIYTHFTAEALLENRNMMPVELVDDLSFSRAQKFANIGEYNLSSIDLPDMTSLKQLSTTDLKENAHFRLKSFVDGNRSDVNLMIRLHEILKT